MSDKFINENFGKYRAGRFKRECPSCSDFWHGYYEAWKHRKKEIEKLQAENKKLILAEYLLRECVEFYSNNFNYSFNGKIDILDGGKQARKCLKELEGEE